MEKINKDTIAFHVIMHQRRRASGDDIRFLDDGQIIRFTDCRNTANNSEYTINNAPNCKIWYSQLSDFFFNDELEMALMIIAFKDGSVERFFDIDSAVFYNRCQGKTFRVVIDSEFKYAIDKESSIFFDRCRGSYAKAYDYLRECFERRDFNAIGDLLRIKNAYCLEEI